MKYMLDTNICIYAMKQQPVSVLNEIHRNIDEGLCISTITLAELTKGIEKSSMQKKNTLALLEFLTALEIIAFDADAAYEYGKICAYLEKRGIPIGNMDMLIAAHARSKQLTIVTNNVREFSRVPDLSVENWVE